MRSAACSRGARGSWSGRIRVNSESAPISRKTSRSPRSRWSTKRTRRGPTTRARIRGVPRASTSANGSWPGVSAITMFVSTVSGSSSMPGMEARAFAEALRALVVVLRGAAGPRARATSPAAAITPAWRIPPPNAFRARMASRWNAPSPHSSAPIGAPSPLLRQNESVSAHAASAPTGTPLATDALKSLAPSMCITSPASMHICRSSMQPDQRDHAASGHVVRVLDDEEPRARMVHVVGRSSDRTVATSGIPSRAGNGRVCTPENLAAPALCTGTSASAPPSAPRRLAAVDVDARSGWPSCRRGRRAPLLAGEPRGLLLELRTVGSSPKTSSPTSASAIARRMAALGRVTVSLRKSETLGAHASLRLRLLTRRARTSCRAPCGCSPRNWRS